MTSIPDAIGSVQTGGFSLVLVKQYSPGYKLSISQTISNALLDDL